MSVERMVSYIPEMRAKFRKVLEEGHNVDIYEFLREALQECCGLFDERTLAENLREVFESWMKEKEEES